MHLGAHSSTIFYYYFEENYFIVKSDFFFQMILIFFCQCCKNTGALLQKNPPRPQKNLFWCLLGKLANLLKDLPFLFSGKLILAQTLVV